MPTIRVAAAQLRASELTDPAAALADIQAAIERAAQQGVELLVLPECAYPAYCLGSAAAYRAAGVMPNPEFVADLAARAKRHRMHIVCGFVEELAAAGQTGSKSCLANSAVIIDDEGRAVGVYRKTFLWGDDNDYFAPGSETRPFQTRLGKIGVIICADARAPETVAAHAMQGAELICMPTCWVNVAQPPLKYYNPQPDFLIPARAREFAVPFVCANKFGKETASVGYCGQSIIVDHDGRKLAESPPDAEALLIQEVIPHAARVFDSDRDILDRLASTEPVRRPVTGGEVRIAVAPSGWLPPDPRSDAGRSFLRTLADGAVGVLHATLEPGTDVPGWIKAAEAIDMTLVGHEPDDRVRDGWFAPYAVIPGKRIQGYATARLRALEGAAILCVIEASDDMALLRARAAENRVYVMASGPATAAIITPTGGILAACNPQSPRPVAAMINPQQAADKLVFPKTDVWEQRRPASWRAAFQP